MRAKAAAQRTLERHMKYHIVSVTLIVMAIVLETAGFSGGQSILSTAARRRRCM